MSRLATERSSQLQSRASESDCCLCREPNFGHGVFAIYSATYAVWEWHVDMDGALVVTDSTAFVRDTTACPCAFRIITPEPCPGAPLECS